MFRICECKTGMVDFKRLQIMTFSLFFYNSQRIETTPNLQPCPKCSQKTGNPACETVAALKELLRKEDVTNVDDKRVQDILNRSYS